MTFSSTDRARFSRDVRHGRACEAVTAVARERETCGAIRASQLAMLIPRTDSIVRRSSHIQGRRVSFLTVERPHTAAVVLLVHGAGVSARTWAHQLRHLSRVGTPIAIDLPGRRDSDPAPAPTLELYADTACRLLETVTEAPAFVAGHSLGGAVAQLLAFRHPERVKGLILLSTCVRVPPGDGAQPLLGLVPLPFRRVVFLSAVRRLLLAPSASFDAIGVTLDEVGGCPTPTIQHDIRIGRGMDLSDVARALRVPTLVLCGAGDRLTPPALSRQLAEAIKGARLQLVPGAGHMLPLEAPDVVNRAMSDFVASVGQDAVVPGRRLRKAARLVERLRQWRPWRRSP